MITGKDIIFISSIEWEFLWQHPQEIALRLAEAGNRVLYVENTGVRSPRIKDAARVVRRLKFWANSLGSGGVRQIQSNLYICSPLVLPPFGPAWRRQINRRFLLPLVRRTARRLGMREPLVWTHLPTDTALELIRLMRTPQTAVVYYCIADFSQLTPHARQLEQSEKAIVQLSEVVFANCTQLAEHCQRWSDNVHVFPPGLNLRAFPLEEMDGSRTAKEAHGSDYSTRQTSAGHKPDAVIGYIGGLHRYVDIELVSEMARARPAWQWIFVGPVQTALGDLAKLPNVLMIGQRPHNELVKHIRSFDVCIVPYLNNQETSTIVPIKINEYLAAGKPVVATELPAVRDFNQQHRVLITAPAQRDSFLKAIEEALKAPNGTAVIGRRREVAAMSDWQERLNAMCQLIEAELQRKVETA